MAAIAEKEFYKGMDELKTIINEESQKTRQAISDMKVDLAKFGARSADNKEEIDRLREHADDKDEENRRRSDFRDIIIAVATALSIILSAILSK